LKGAAVAALLVAGIAVWALYRRAPVHDAPEHTAVENPTPESSAAGRADAAFPANHLATPNDDSTPELYQQALAFQQTLARNPADAAAKAGLAEVQDRL
jgi:hypothetical protein